MFTFPQIKTQFPDAVSLGTREERGSKAEEPDGGPCMEQRPRFVSLQWDKSSGSLTMCCYELRVRHMKIHS